MVDKDANSEGERRFRDEHCEGKVTDMGQDTTMGFYSGRLFEADVEGNHGKTHVRFLIQTALLHERALEFNPFCWMRIRQEEVDDPSPAPKEFLN